MSCQELFIGTTFFQQWEDFCCKMYQSLYKCDLPAPPFSLSFLSLGPHLALPLPPRAVTVGDKACSRGLRGVRRGPFLPGELPQAGEQSKA